ncbi:hypothetical protein EsH8_V_001186 [Colletotrichum jinshuiense]
MDDARSANVHDFRSTVNTVNLKKNGYEIVPMLDRKWNLMAADDDLQRVEIQKYLTDLCQLVKEHLGARFVTHFVSQVRPRCLRKADPDAITPLKKFTVPRPHCDFTDRSMPKIWELLNFDDELERWQEGIDMVVNDPSGISPRCQILGAWKPLQTVKRTPLCLVDPRTVPAEDWVRVPPAPKWAQNGGSWLLRHDKPGRSEHSWHYISDQTPEELLLFVHEDTDPNAIGRVPHTALDIPGTEHLPDRQSVETRLFVVY